MPLQKRTLVGALEDYHLGDPDVTLVCGDGVVVHGHKVSLSASSSFFYSILKDHTLHPVNIFLPDISSTCIDILINFIDKGVITIDREQLEGVLDMVNQFQIHCFSGSETPGNLLERGFSVNESISESGSKATGEEEDEMNSGVITEQEFKLLKDGMVQENLLKQASGWKCTLCGRTWNGDSINSRRHSKRHMESHLDVRFMCLGCRSVMKSKESFYFHRARYCKNFYEFDDPGFHIVVKEERAKQDKIVRQNIVVNFGEAEVSKNRDKPAVINVSDTTMEALEKGDDNITDNVVFVDDNVFNNNVVTNTGTNDMGEESDSSLVDNHVIDAIVTILDTEITGAAEELGTPPLLKKKSSSSENSEFYGWVGSAECLTIPKTGYRVLIEGAGADFAELEVAGSSFGMTDIDLLVLPPQEEESLLEVVLSKPIEKDVQKSKKRKAKHLGSV